MRQRTMTGTRMSRASLYGGIRRVRSGSNGEQMGNLQSGGGTSAVAASAHAGCRRFRLTDPFLTRKTRTGLAAHIGSPDTTGGIPEARWMRAMTFERLVHDEQ